MQQANTQQINHTGLFLIGTLKGFLEDHRTGNDGNPWVRHFVGIELPKPNGFPGETEVVRAQVPRDLVSQGITGKYESLIGKQVRADVWVRAYPTRGGAGFSYNLANYLDCIQPTSANELKKVS